MIPRIKSGNTLKIFSFYFIIFSNYLKSNKKDLILFSTELELSMTFPTFEAKHKSTLRKIFLQKIH